MTKITYEDKMEYLEKRREWLKGTLDMILRLHPEGDHRTEDLQHKLDIIECITEELEVLDILKENAYLYVNIKEDVKSIQINITNCDDNFNKVEGWLKK